MSFIRILFAVILISTGFSFNCYATEPAPAMKSIAQNAIDLNTASVNSLTTVKGISPKKAQAIVDYRSQHGLFKSVNELAHVKGFSENSLAKILKNNPGRLTVKTMV
jgi:comEA protein